METLLLPSRYLTSVGVELPAIVAIVLLIVAFGPALRTSTETKFWRSQQFVGYSEKEWFSKIRAQIRTIFDTTPMTFEGYHNFSKHGRPFALPMFANKPCLILPPELAQDLLNRPDHEVSDRLVHIEALQAQYTIPKGLVEDDYHFDLLRRQLTRRLPQVTADIAEEIHFAFRDYWPGTTDWSSVRLYPLVTRVVARAANRVFVGKELCRNEEFLAHSSVYAVNVFMAGLSIRLVPKFLRPLIAPFIVYPNRKHYKACITACRPVVEKRLASMAQQRSDSPDPNYEHPNDFLQWLLDEHYDAGDQKRLDPAELTARLMNLNMVAIHTSSLIFTSFVFDLYSSPDASDFLAGLRDEIDLVKPKNGTSWTKPTVQELVRIDSALRESMRFSDIGDLSGVRIVTAPGGVDFPKGLHVPLGASVGLPARPIHRDPENYARPDEYDAFRFSAAHERPVDGLESSKTSILSGDQSMGIRSYMVKTTDKFLSFGAGKHACPGRFFAAHELKLMVAYLLDNYDVEMLAERPKGFNIIGVSGPDDKAEIRTRARQIVT